MVFCLMYYLLFFFRRESRSWHSAFLWQVSPNKADTVHKAIFVDTNCHVGKARKYLWTNKGFIPALPF